jgi:hypothetical protein
MREQILSVFFDKLHALKDTMPSIMIERNRDSEVQRFPTVVMVDGGHKASYVSNGFTNYDMEVTIEGYVEADSSKELGNSVNDLYSRVVEISLSDLTFEGLVIDIMEDNFEIEINRSCGIKPNAAFALTFIINYIQPLNNWRS